MMTWRTNTGEGGDDGDGAGGGERGEGDERRWRLAVEKFLGCLLYKRSCFVLASRVRAFHASTSEAIVD